MQKLYYFRSLLITILACIAVLSHAQQVTTPRVPSPAAEVSQTIGISKITVNYSRPSVKGREIWGKLVPYGWNVQQFGAGNSAPWRAGANENTTINFSHDAKVEGHIVPAGTYGLFFVINNDNSGEVILSKDFRSWGSFFYNQKNDELRAPISVRDASATEMLTYSFDKISKNATELELNWDKKQFPVKIEFDVDKIVMGNAAQELKGPTGFAWQGYFSAANYALQNNTNLDEAITWIDKAIAQNKTFNTLNTKSGLLKAKGQTTDADKVMNEASNIATENDLNLYAYNLMKGGQQDKAIEIFILNTKKHPESANVWDSLGEAYALKGDKQNAITNFKKSLSLNPPANVKANSEKYLKQTGAM